MAAKAAVLHLYDVDMSKSGLLGVGSYGSVRAARCRGAGGGGGGGGGGDGAPPLVVKTERFCEGVDHSKRLFREALLMRALNSTFSGNSHAAFPLLRDLRLDSKSMHLVMSFGGRSLRDLLKADVEAKAGAPKVVFAMPQVRDLAWQLLLGVHYLHTAAAGFMHRDIKAANCLLAPLVRGVCRAALLRH